MSYLDPADRLRSLLERMHRPDATLSARRRRADLIRSPEARRTMPNRYRIDPAPEDPARAAARDDARGELDR